MNICFYTDQTISGMTGGIGRITSVMVNYFRTQFGWKVFSIFAADAKIDCLLTQTDGAIKLRLHDRLNFRQDVKKNYPRAVQFLKENAVECIIIQTSLDVVAKLRKVLDNAGLNQIRIVSVLHFAPGKDEWPWVNAMGIKKIIAPIRNWFIHRATVDCYRSAYEKGEKVFLLSPSYISQYKDYAGLKGTSKLIAMPNCLSFSEGISETELSAKKPFALVVARMEEVQKRISLILKIWANIEQSDNVVASKWELKIVGDGPSLPMYRQMATELKLKRVTFTGRQDPIPYYKQSSLFLMTSSFEGFPMTLVEASQFGCVPVVYNSFTSLCDVVNEGQNGYIIEEGDEAGFITQTLRLMTDNALRIKLSKQAVKDCQRFSQEKICQQWRQILEL